MTMTNIETGDTVHIINRLGDGVATITKEGKGCVKRIDARTLWFEGSNTSFVTAPPTDEWEVEIVSIEKPYVIGGVYEIHRPAREPFLRRRVEGGWQMLESGTVYTDAQHREWGDAIQRRVLIVDYPGESWASELAGATSWLSPGSPADLIHKAIAAEKERS